MPSTSASVAPISIGANAAPKLRAREDRDEKRGNVVQVRQNDVAWAHSVLPQYLCQRIDVRKELSVCQLGLVGDDGQAG